MFRQTKRRVLERTNNTEDVLRHTNYPNRLNFYTVPPVREITLDQFEEWAIDRVKVLGEVDRCIVNNITGQAQESFLKPFLSKHLPLSISGSAVETERKKDHYSHFILRLAFCRNPELRAKFVRLETALFKYRYNTDDSSARNEFIQSLNFDWEPVSMSEQEELSPFLTAASGKESGSADDGNNSSYFKVDFEKVSDLVEQRKVFLHKGKAYVPNSLQQSLVLAEFTSRLEIAMEMTARALPRLDEDQRLIPILTHLSTGFSWSKYEGPTYSDEGFTADKVEKLDQDGHFPLCMHHMNHALQVNQHAKYNTRLQFGLFLKGIGLSIDESLKFWRMSFKKITEDRFNKDYAYNIKHTYALVGGRKNYSPMNCIDIGSSKPVGADQTHGCPYKEFSPDRLAAALREMGITDKSHLAEIRNLTDSRHYHLACTKVYQLKHPMDTNHESITHPNTYFSRSYEYSKELASTTNNS